MKKCAKCGGIKALGEFFRNKHYKLGVSSYCKSCQREYNRTYLAEWSKTERGKLLIRQKGLRYRKKLYSDPDRLNLYREHQAKNVRTWTKTEKGKLHVRKMGRSRLKNSINRLKQNVSRSIRTAMIDRKEGRSWEFLVGYTVKDLIAHLERQFDNKMNWMNYGSYWHIDHIYPLAMFRDFDDITIKKAWALDNLRPLEAKENLSKKDNWEYSPGVFIRIRKNYENRTKSII